MFGCNPPLDPKYIVANDKLVPSTPLVPYAEDRGCVSDAH